MLAFQVKRFARGVRAAAHDGSWWKVDLRFGEDEAGLMEAMGRPGNCGGREAGTAGEEVESLM